MARKVKRSTSAPPRIPLRELMAAHGVSLAELSRRTGITQPLLRAYREGHTQPTFPALIRLAEALEVGLGAFEPDGRRGVAHAV